MKQLKPFQQRRVLSGCLCIQVSAATLALLISSCASLTPERVNLLIPLATQAAQLGTQIYLQTHPAHRPAVEQTVKAFANAVKEGKTNAVEYLNSLPTATLTEPGSEGALYVSGNRLLVWNEVAGKSYPITNLPPIVAAFKRGIAPMPPRFPARTKRGPLVVTDGAGWAEPQPLSDAELDAQFERVKAALVNRTNIVSTVDVQPQPNGASVVTVRWQARPGVYRVEQRDEGSVEWLHFGYATNAASWETGWHPSLPVGHWRVIRVK